MADNLLPAATTLFLLLLTLTTADTDTDLVLDMDGNPLEVGSQYYMQPGPWSFQGGIGRYPMRGPGFPCPLYAIQYPSELIPGDPFKFKHVDGNQTEIHLSLDVQIDSGFSALCRDNGLWRLTPDPINRRTVVLASGASNVPRSSFKIEKTEIPLGIYYKIKYCPPTSSLRLRGSSCVYLTLFPDRRFGLNMVGLTNDPAQALQVFFKKYKEGVVAGI